MKALPNWKNLDTKTQKHWGNPFSVSVMEDLPKIDQPAGNNECGFYVMWAMLVYFGGSPKEGNKIVSSPSIFYCFVSRLCMSISFCFNYSANNVITTGW